MGAVHFSNRSPSSEFEAAMMLCADFAAVCKAVGDMSNYHRWRNELGRARVLASAGAPDQICLAAMAGRSVVAEKQQNAQLSLM